MVEDLFHDGVLAEVVVAAFEELFVFEAVGAEGGDDFGHADAGGESEFREEFRDVGDAGIVAIGSEIDFHCWGWDFEVLDVLLEPLACSCPS